ncbi:hypothetical protein ABK040_002778 [Willaertia magna]
MRIAVFSSKPYDESSFTECNNKLNTNHEFTFFSQLLDQQTVQVLAQHDNKFDAVCPFVNDKVTSEVIEKLNSYGVKLIVNRSAGYNNIDVEKAKECGMQVGRVPEYSPYSVAEMAIAHMLTLNRKTHKAFQRVRECDFSINGLMGFDLKGKNVGIVGTGKIGQIVCKILKCGFDCNVLCYDVFKNQDLIQLGCEYVELDDLLARSEIISLHCPLFESTKYIINEKSIKKMKDGCMLINTSRGALVNTDDLIEGLKSGKVGAYGADTYENEADYFYHDFSKQQDISPPIKDERLIQLVSGFPQNVLITAHQAYFTKEAMCNIAESVLRTCEKYGKENCIGDRENAIKDWDNMQAKQKK